MERNEYEVSDCPICFEPLQFETRSRSKSAVKPKLWDAKSRKEAMDAAKEGYKSVQALLGYVERPAFALSCGHIFCEPCIKEWLKRSTQCPLCKEETITEGKLWEIQRKHMIIAICLEMAPVQSRNDIPVLDALLYERELAYRRRRLIMLTQPPVRPTRTPRPPSTSTTRRFAGSAHRTQHGGGGSSAGRW